MGLAPLSDPRLVVAVMIDEPSGTAHYGGDVAGPAFSVSPPEPARWESNRTLGADGARECAGRKGVCDRRAGYSRPLRCSWVELRGVADDSRRVRRETCFSPIPATVPMGVAISGMPLRGAAAVVWEPGVAFAWDAAGGSPGAKLYFAGPGRPARPRNLRPPQRAAFVGGHRHQWQDDRQPVDCAQLPSPAASSAPSGGIAGALAGDRLHHAGSDYPDGDLAEFHRGGAVACALEASSIGIEEGAHERRAVDVAVFTNLTRDHLDYHGTMDAYAAAKERLFPGRGWGPQSSTSTIPSVECWPAQTIASRILGYGWRR